MLDKSQIPLVNIEAMNEIHFEEVEIINTLGNLIEKEDIQSITKQMQILIDHMQHHFSYEEDMMKNKSYPMYRVHQSDHNKVLSETRYIFMDWRNMKDIDRLKEYFQEDLLTWLDQHIKAMDTPMAEFIDGKV
jgi:hemerythrin